VPDAAERKVTGFAPRLINHGQIEQHRLGFSFFLILATDTIRPSVQQIIMDVGLTPEPKRSIFPAGNSAPTVSAEHSLHSNAERLRQGEIAQIG
jgi:hypothetical protein